MTFIKQTCEKYLALLFVPRDTKLSEMLLSKKFTQLHFSMVLHFFVQESKN